MNGSGSNDQPLFFRRSTGPKPVPYWPIERCKRKALIGTCLSSDLIGTMLHYDGKRSFACLGDEYCQMDHRKNVPRKTFFIGAMVHPGCERKIIQMTDRVEAAWDEAFCLYRTLRGVKFKLHRSPETTNGKLFCVTGKRDLNLDELPKCPDIVEMLWRIWDLPPDLLPLNTLSLTPLERKVVRENLG
jgi:hypothetical protein